MYFNAEFHSIPSTRHPIFTSHFQLSFSLSLFHQPRHQFLLTHAHDRNAQDSVSVKTKTDLLNDSLVNAIVTSDTVTNFQPPIQTESSNMFQSMSLVRDKRDLLRQRGLITKQEQSKSVIPQSSSLPRIPPASVSVPKCASE